MVTDTAPKKKEYGYRHSSFFVILKKIEFARLIVIVLMDNIQRSDICEIIDLHLRTTAIRWRSVMVCTNCRFSTTADCSARIIIWQQSVHSIMTHDMENGERIDFCATLCLNCMVNPPVLSFVGGLQDIMLKFESRRQNIADATAIMGVFYPVDVFKIVLDYL